MAAAQLPKCSHYVTDVVAGLTVGLIAEALVARAWQGMGWAKLDGSIEPSPLAQTAAKSDDAEGYASLRV